MFNFLKLNKDEPKDVQKFFDKMDSRSVRKEITSAGDVQIISVTAIKDKNDESFEFETDDEAEKDIPENIIKVVGCIFKKNGTIKNLQQVLEFDVKAKSDVVDQLNTIKSRLEDRRETAQQELDLLPKNLKDDHKVLELDSKIQDIEDRKNNVYSSAIYDDNLLLVRCGRYIKYQFLNESMFDDDANTQNIFVDIKLNFDKHFEIVKILDTCTPYQMQIIARNRES